MIFFNSLFDYCDDNYDLWYCTCISFLPASPSGSSSIFFISLIFNPLSYIILYVVVTFSTKSDYVFSKSAHTQTYIHTLFHTFWKISSGRTGVMISAYFMYSKEFSNPDDALHHFGMKRTANGMVCFRNYLYFSTMRIWQSVCDTFVCIVIILILCIFFQRSTYFDGLGVFCTIWTM